MKAVTVIVRTDPDDELPAILDRLPANAPCVLVLPPHSRALNGVVAAKLLNRRANALSSRVVVVTDDRAVIAHLRAAGVPSAQTVEEAHTILAVDGPDAETAPDQPPPAEATAEAPAEGREERHSNPTIPLSSAVFTAGTHANGHQEPSDEAAAQPDPTPPDQDENVETTPIRGHSGGIRGARDATRPAAPMTPTTPFSAPPQHTPTARLQAGRRTGAILLTAGIAIIVLLLLLWLLSYLLGGLLNPSATVTLHPRAQSINAGTVVRAALNLPPAQRNPYHVAMASVEQPEQHMVALPVRGTKALPGRVATGELRLRNFTTKPLVVPAGTTFTTALNRVSFVSTRSVTLRAAIETFSSTTFGVGTIAIRAAVGGTAGNVPARAIVNVPAGFAGALGVQNAAPTRGGTDRHIRIVAPHDLTVAAARLFGALEQQAAHDIARRRGGDVVVHTLFVARSTVQPQVAADQRTATLVLSIVLHATYVHGRDLIPAARAALQQAVSNAASGATLIPSSITWVPTWNPDNTVALAVSGRTAAPLKVAEVLRAIGGRSKAEAAAYLKGRPDIVFSAADLDVAPPWADHLPGDPTHIHVVVGEPR